MNFFFFNSETRKEDSSSHQKAMLIGISGTLSSGQLEILRYLTYQGFTYVDYAGRDKSLPTGITFKTYDELIDHVTLNWRDNFVITHLEDAMFLELVAIRPFFLHITVDSPIILRYKRYIEKSLEKIELEKFIEKSDFLTFNKLSKIIPQLDLKIVNDREGTVELYQQLSSLNLTDTTRLRPSWDQYFMGLADLASRRSNCMKRRVGCVIVRENRILSTGYNGTPKNLTNCNEGGCERCNKGLDNANCLCLHLEENALLESGRDRVGTNSVLYCNTCPCLQCTIKIIQTGISCVVYRNEYKFDKQSKTLLDEAGIAVRQF